MDLHSSELENIRMNRKKIKIRYDGGLLCLPLNENGNLSIKVLKQYFPNAQALTYTDNGQICGLDVLLDDIIINPAVDYYNVHIVEGSEEKEYGSDTRKVFFSRESWIQKYFRDGYTYQEIVNFLSKRHNILISVRHLIRILKTLGLKRRNIEENSLDDICSAIIEELYSSGCCIGYKSIWRRLQLVYGLKVKRSTVYKILNDADPDGIRGRSRRRLCRRKYNVPGPNFLWHIDGYDKLKPFGFAIHGCIDGFLRKILWLDVATSNNKPEIIAYYYLETVKKLQVLPTLIRSDHGTENCLVESLQQSFRLYHDDKFSGYKSFIKGKSTSNQRIESYWSQLRRHGLDFWICLFKDMRDRNIYDDSNYIDVECLRYCFGPLIKTDLEIIRREWNRHRIRKQKNRRIPAGKPNCLFYLPEMIGMKNYKKPVDNDAIKICKTYYSIEPKLYTEDFHQLVQEILSDRVISPSIEDALEMYLQFQNA